ncbi:MAG: DUF3575 domain-containing protein [Chitinophagaceae bacterium]|nr:MAG: DUF3575 domain-containing protein [Chitinophagaceae bacterium]
MTFGKFWSAKVGNPAHMPKESVYFFVNLLQKPCICSSSAKVAGSIAISCTSETSPVFTDHFIFPYGRDCLICSSILTINCIMKKTILALGLAAVAFGAQAQKSNAIKANIFSPIVKSGSFFYERKINEKMTGQIGVGFTAYNKTDVGFNGIFITPEFRYYLTGEALDGVYVGPFVRYQNLKISDESSSSKENATLSTFGGGAVIGRQWLFGNIVTLDIFIGPSFNTGKIKYDDGNGNTEVPGSLNGFGVRTGLTVGVAF